jgi:N-acetylneuraminate synthase
MNIGAHPIYNFRKPYIIAELGSNHNGDMELAKKLIEQAKIAGCDCVKFQSWTKDTIFSQKVYKENYFLKDDYRNRSDYNLEEIVEEFSISEQELLEMRNYCREQGIDFASTPFSNREVDFLVDKLEATFIKVASMDLNNYPFLEYIARKGVPVMLSTGLSEMYEIDQAVRTIENAGNAKIILLHCVSIYPPKDESVHLNNIDMLRANYPDYPVGFSDHTIGIEIPLAAVAKGASVIEKHFTLDKSMFGWDHKVSATSDEMKAIVEGSKRIVAALGSYRRVLSQDDEEKKPAFRRSIVAARTIPEGKVIEVADLDFKRPGTGIEPQYYKLIIGRIARRTIQYDEIIQAEDF